MSGHETFPFLDLPAELRNRIYTFTCQTQNNERCYVLPCSSLMLVCRQLRSEYRPICMKRAVMIDWRDVRQYLDTFYPTVDGKVTNIELAPAAMTVFVDHHIRNGSRVSVDILPLLRIRHRHNTFTCDFVIGDETKQDADAVGDYFDHDEHSVSLYVRKENDALFELFALQNKHWLNYITSNIFTGIDVPLIGSPYPEVISFYIDLEEDVNGVIDGDSFVSSVGLAKWAECGIYGLFQFDVMN
ncbi:hypothetical protein P153DRAFT_409020 [Dothidotthia symphoricarpi CBS 119687]|uniref:F-box domain-containing protein n=1 Tax=Dothidotthia symphoricarpi CBS 119687 TaxID=1392245 RepID=A0A6A6AS66_9PLEO|nr:uncharacterized protein P153DRAFT_409020 [Dothidotthia symphoricarpi CBS 119687]KAF2133774.1 hypothetical protein P153DRAFT_409020 [Dothidotthia symphoricarpi CBS 119687]